MLKFNKTTFYRYVTLVCSVWLLFALSRTQIITDQNVSTNPPTRLPMTSGPVDTKPTTAQTVTAWTVCITLAFIGASAVKHYKQKQKGDNDRDPTSLPNTHIRPTEEDTSAETNGIQEKTNM